MARASRSNKKQPAFDPSELTDLIFTPAVGTGVGSHLLATVDFPAPVEHQANRIADMSTVDITKLTTVDISDMSTVDMYELTGKDEPLVVDMTTVVNTDMATVVNTDVATVGESQPAGQGREGECAVISNLSTVATSPGSVILWITEQGDLVAEGRVKKIRQAQDVINSAEASVYDTLWGADPFPTPIPSDSRNPSRVVEAGYDYLVKRTQLSKRTIQRIIDKLIEKDFIAIERPADIYRRSSTVYRVFSYQTVLDRHIQKGRFHVAKLGPGFSYVRLLSHTSPQ